MAISMLMAYAVWMQCAVATTQAEQRPVAVDASVVSNTEQRFSPATYLQALAGRAQQVGGGGLAGAG
eukprot:scaffold298074_cov38-Prasinocladus_malaysianus.AAC.1